MLPPNSIASKTQTPNQQQQAILRQPVLYIALPTAQKHPVHTCVPCGQIVTVTTSTTASTTIGRNSASGSVTAQTNGLTEPSRGQVCTCPPEVHKALLEGQLATQRERNDAEVRSAPMQLSLHNLRAFLPANTNLSLATTGRAPILAPGSTIRLAVSDNSVQSGSLVRLPSGAQWILIPSSQLTATSSVGTINPQAVITSAPANSLSSLVGTGSPPVTLSSSSGSSNERQLMDEQKPPPDVLLTSVSTPGAVEVSHGPSTMPEAKVRLACMEGQLAHLSAWVQVLQQSPGVQVNAKNLAGYSHRNCANNNCRVTADAASTVDRESNYTPSNSSLDSAYSARSTNSSESVSAKQLIDGDSTQPVIQHFPVYISPDGTGANQTIPSTIQLSNTIHHANQQQQQQQHPQVPPTQQLSATAQWASDYCHLVGVPNYGALIDQPTSTAGNMQFVTHRLGLAQTELSTLKTEIATLRRAQSACMSQHKEATADVLEKIKRMIASVDGLDLGLIQKARLTINRQLDIYEREAKRASAWLKDLDATIEDLRMVALTRRCRISVSEVEMLALHVNRISFRLRNFKNELPKISERLQSLIDAEMRQINRNKGFLDNEFGRIEEALTRCKQLTSTLFTLKRLGSVQQNGTSENIPTIRTVREPTAEERQNLFDRIVSIRPDHEARVHSMQTFEDLRTFRELIKDPDVTQPFENELIFPEEDFVFACTPSPSPELKPVDFAPGRHRSRLSHRLHPDSGSDPDSIEFFSVTNRVPLDDTSLVPHQNSSDHHPKQRSHGFQFYETKVDEDDENEHDDLTDAVTNFDSIFDDTYMGANRFMDDPYDLNFTMHSQDEVIHREPISITQDPLVSLASPPKSKLRDSPSSPQDTFRTSRKTVDSSGTAAPTILKRAQSSVSSGPGSKLPSARPPQSVPTRRSRVVFSRTVLVGNGSETVQLNCPSETDDEDDRRRQVHRTEGNFSVDDLVINRTSQPWIHARKPDGTDTRDLAYSRSTKSRTKTAVRRTYRPGVQAPSAVSGPLYRSYQDRAGSIIGPSPVVMKPATNGTSTGHPGQHHHHNCQAARQATKTGVDVGNRDTV